jgi:hypothetical protein
MSGHLPAAAPTTILITAADAIRIIVQKRAEPMAGLATARKHISLRLAGQGLQSDGNRVILPRLRRNRHPSDYRCVQPAIDSQRCDTIRA